MSRIPTRRWLAWPAILLPAIAGATAGRAPEDPVPAEGAEERVEVVAEHPWPEDPAAFVTHLDAAELRSRALDLGGLLRRVPGARVRDYGGFQRFTTVSLRGASADQVTVLVDGIPQNRALGGPVDLSFLPASQIESVSVFRGFAPASLGFGGIGGLVDIRTSGPPSPEPRGQVDLLVGELATARLSTGWSVPAGPRGSFQVGGSWLQSDGDFLYRDTGATLFDPSDDRTRTRSNNDFEDGSLYLQGAWQGVGDGELRFITRYQGREGGVPGLDSFPAESARLDEQLASGQVGWSRIGAGRVEELDLTIDGFRQSVGFRDLGGELGVGLQDQTTRIRGGGFSAVVRTPVGRHGLLTRVDLRAEEASVVDDVLQVSDRGGAARRLAMVNFEDTITAGRVVVTPSVRWQGRRDDFTAAGGGTLPPPAEDLQDSLWSGRLGMAVRVGSGCSLRGSAGTFFRTPSLLELFGDRGSVIGNPALRPEQGRSVEAGGSCEGGHGAFDWGFEVVGFRRDTEDLILFVPNSQGTAVAQNLGAARVRGMEGMLGLRWGDWVLDASGTLQRTEDVSEGYTGGHPLVGVPERLGYVGLSWSRGRMGVRWDVSYVGANSTDRLDTEDLRLPARVIHDLGVWWNVAAGIRIGLDVDNVLDRETRDVARFPLPGRLIFLSLGWRMGP